MSRRASSARLIAACTLVAALPAPASATTRVVDDDRLQCPLAGYTRIQAAVAASGPRDEVRVCAGRYPEHVRVGPHRNGLRLLSHTRLGARVSAVRINTPIIAVASRDVVVNGFDVAGPYRSSRPGCGGLQPAYEVGILTESGGSATIAGNRVSDLYHVGCPGYGIGIRQSFVVACDDYTRGVIEGNTVERFALVGIDIYCGDAFVRRNTVRGDGRLSRDGIFVYYHGFGDVRDNDVSGSDRGIRVRGYEEGNVIAGNRVHHNRLGILIQEVTVPWLVRDNLVTHNRVRGLSANGSGSTFRTNRALDNGVDCADAVVRGGTGTAGTRNTWVGNVGATSLPRAICRAP